MSPAVVDGLKVLKSASYLMPWLDTANSPRVAAAWLSSLQALAGGSMTPGAGHGRGQGSLGRGREIRRWRGHPLALAAAP